MMTKEGSVFKIPNCRITRCGYTGEDGVEISVPAKHAASLAEILLYTKGRIVKLAGLGARDTLRTEAGLCLYGSDIDTNTTPVEAGLAWLIHKRRREEKNFPGSDIILAQLLNKPEKRRVGFIMANKFGPSARSHMKFYDSNGEKMIGEITSGCRSITLDKNIGMGYIDTQYSKPETPILIDIRNKKYEASIVKMPFVKTNYYFDK
jgi:aminomethyltransferase